MFKSWLWTFAIATCLMAVTGCGATLETVTTSADLDAAYINETLIPYCQAVPGDANQAAANAMASIAQHQKAITEAKQAISPEAAQAYAVVILQDLAELWRLIQDILPLLNAPQTNLKASPDIAAKWQAIQAKQFDLKIKLESAPVPSR